MMPFGNSVGKQENAGNQHFLLFPQCFLPISIGISVFKLNLFCFHASRLNQPKNLSSGKQLNQKRQRVIAIKAFKI